MMLYYPLEYAAYAGWKMPALSKRKGLDAERANRVSAASCVFWTSYIVGDFWCSVLKWKELKGRLGRVREDILGEAKRRRGDNGDNDAIRQRKKR